MIKVYKIPTSAFSLIIDIPLLILFTQNIQTDMICKYIHIRIFMISLAPLVLLFKLFKNCFFILKNCGLFKHMLSIIRFEKEMTGVYNFLINLMKFYFFIVEYFLLMACFMYSLTNADYIFTSSNNLILFLTIIPLTVLLAIIEIYLSKRYNSIIDIFKKSPQKTNI